MDVDPRQYENVVSSFAFGLIIVSFLLCFVSDRIGWF